MELFSRKFQRSIESLLALLAKSEPKFLFLATVPIKNLKFTDNLKAHPSAKLFTVSVIQKDVDNMDNSLTSPFDSFKVTHQNRNKMFDQIYEFISNSYKNL